MREFPQEVSPPQTPSQGQSYAGDRVCLGCHSDQRNGYELTGHRQPADPRSPGAREGCETCHGPGSLHADNDSEVDIMYDFRTMAPDAINDRCTDCHNRGEHALWDGSQHERRDLACTSCHTLHNRISETGALNAPTQTEVCASCHADKASKVARTSHMPVREGKMECATCHSPHGSTNVSLLKTGDSIAEACTSCHAEKRGPYLWEHAPSRDGCVTCHDPHGSSSERMLVARTPMLCQRCHVASRHPSNIYDATQMSTGLRVVGRSCVTCHANLHGSNQPAGRFFLR